MTPENIQKVLDLLRRLRSEEFAEQQRNIFGYVDELVEMFDQSDLQIKLAPTSQRKRSVGGFFKHLNLTKFDLRRYGVYQKESDIDCEDNCLFIALKHDGFPETQLNDLRYSLKTRDIPEYRLKEVCDMFACQIRLSKRGRTEKYGVKGDMYNIGLLDEHYFVNDECTMCTAYAIEHYDQLKDVSDCHRIFAKEGKKWKRSDKRFSKSFHIIETLLNSQYVKPITYSDEILASTFHKKFKQKTGIVLKDIPTSNFKKPNETNYVQKKGH